MHYILYAFLTIIIIIIVLLLLLLIIIIIIIIIIIVNYYYYYYYYYYHYHYRCYFLFATEAISNYWGGLLGPPLLFSLVRLRRFFFRHKKGNTGACYAGYDWQ